MADFRKWILVLAVVALATGSAFAQPTFNCNASQAVNKTVRAGGITERVGDVIATCQPVPGGTTVTVNFLATMPSNVVTDRILGGDAGQGFPIAAALQTKDANGNIYQTVQGLLQRLVPVDNQAQRNVVVFPNVVVPRGTTLVPVGGTAPGAFTIRIYNIRVLVPLGTAPGSTIGELVATSDPSSVPVVNPFPTVATVANPLTFSVTNCSGGSASLPAFRQCIAASHHVDFGVTFREGFASAFRNVGTTAPLPAPGLTLDDTLQESGEQYTILSPPGSAPGAVIGDQASNGTQLKVTFTNVPAGVQINVTNHPTAVLPAGTDPSLLDAFLITSASTVGESDCGPEGNAMFPANASGSTVTATWEVSANEPSLIESLTFGVDIFYNPSLPTLPALTGSTPGAIFGTLAPVGTNLYANSVDPIVRFQDMALEGTSPLTIVPCVTNLLFPYLTSSLQYDTGISIANTTLDNPPFATPLQTGPCTLYFFGQQNGAVATIAPQVTPAVPAGQLVLFTLTNPLPGFADLTEFQGYMIARCQFQMAHGLAFIVDTNLPGFGSEAYLALIIPDVGQSARTPDPFSAMGAGSGEQLVH